MVVKGRGIQTISFQNPEAKIDLHIETVPTEPGIFLSDTKHASPLLRMLWLPGLLALIGVGRITGAPKVYLGAPLAEEQVQKRPDKWKEPDEQ
jgi:hypothetical protein